MHRISTLENWRARIAECAELGFTPREYCEACELSLALFLRWRRRLSETAAAVSAPGGDCGLELVEVCLPRGDACVPSPAEASSSSDSGVFLEHGSWRILLPRGFDAPPPATPACLGPDSDRCHYDVSVVAHVVAAKVVDHLPFHRQEQMFLRMGVRFGRAAMCGYFATAAGALEPLFAVLFAEVKACPVLHGDETPVDVPGPGAGKTAAGWLRALRTGVGPPLVAFEFSMDRSGATAMKILADYFGTLVRDGYAACGQLPAAAAGCRAHVRRKFFEAQDNHPALAAEAIALVRRLYAHERDAREAAMRRRTETALFKERRKVRRLSAPVADAFFALCRRIGEQQPPASSIARAARYAADREAELRRFLADPRLDIDNNPCENVIRPFCLGRKNWLFAGGQEGVRCMAVLASFAATCKENGVDFEKWLLDVLVRIDRTTPKQLPSLLPHLWKTAATQA